jgi:OTU domain-containing protein 6
METLENVQARHRKEQRDLQSRITSKKKNATKKTRKGVNDECTELEHQLKQKQAQEISVLNGEEPAGDDGAEDDEEDDGANGLDNSDGNAAPGKAPDGVTQQMKRVTIAEPPTSEPTSPATTQSQEPKTKRNRQKERLARRAAEQESAAQAAEEEAANMTDHRKIEKTYLLKEFKTHGLVEKEILPDGHCLFAAVADQLAQAAVPLGPEAETRGRPAYKVVRRRATDYMEAHPDDFAPFLEEDLAGYAARIRDTAEWGGQLELTALANAYGVEIKVLQDGRTETIGPAARGDETKSVWLAYYRHGYGLGEHYNSLRKTG